MNMPAINVSVPEELTQLIVVDVEDMVKEAVEMRLASVERAAYVRAVASGVPAAEAYTAAWHRMRR